MRDLTENIESQFISLRDKTLDLLNVVPEDILFLAVPLKNEFFRMTIGECVLRSAAASEQAFGGLMTRLWDDPFEWTLPESLSDREKVREYINEVDIHGQDLFYQR